MEKINDGYGFLEHGSQIPFVSLTQFPFATKSNEIAPGDGLSFHSRERRDKSNYMPNFCEPYLLKYPLKSSCVGKQLSQTYYLRG